MIRKIITLSIAGLLFLISFAATAQNTTSLYDAVSKIQETYPDLHTLNLKSANMNPEASQEKDCWKTLRCQGGGMNSLNMW